MGTHKILLTLIFCLLAFCSFGVDSRSYERRVECVAEFYTQEIGVRELTGRNDGPRVQMYLKTTGLQGNYAWCAAFVNWVYKAADISPRAKHTPGAWSWFTENTIPIEQAAKGDVFGLFYPKLNRIGHIGFIDEVTDNGFITVEGNTNAAGAREGNGVWRKRRMQRSVFKVARWIR